MPGVRALIDGASLGPEALKAVGRAFDEAWADIARPFSRGPTGRGRKTCPCDRHSRVATFPW